MVSSDRTSTILLSRSSVEDCCNFFKLFHEQLLKVQHRKNRCIEQKRIICYTISGLVTKVFYARFAKRNYYTSALGNITFPVSF